jgi:hypothetical protein
MTASSIGHFGRFFAQPLEKMAVLFSKRALTFSKNALLFADKIPPE